MANHAKELVIPAFPDIVHSGSGPNTPFTLQAVSPVVGHVWGNVPVLGSPSDVRRRPCESVVNHPLPCES